MQGIHGQVENYLGPPWLQKSHLSNIVLLSIQLPLLNIAQLSCLSVLFDVKIFLRIVLSILTK